MGLLQNILIFHLNETEDLVHSAACAVWSPKLTVCGVRPFALAMGI